MKNKAGLLSLITLLFLNGCISFPKAETAYKIQQLESEGKYKEAYELKKGLDAKPKAEFWYDSQYDKRYEKGDSEEELKINDE